MGIIATQQQLPPPQTPIVVQSFNATKDFRYLLLSLLTRTGGTSGVPTLDIGATVQTGTPYLIKSDWTQFTTVPAGQLAQLPDMAVGTEAIVLNDGANPIDINPQPNVILDTPIPGRYTLANGKMQWFRCLTPTLIKSMQLG